MTRLERDVDYTDASDSADFRERRLLRDINTCIPGHIVSYDPEAQRADVRPAIDRLVLDDDGEARQEREVIVNAPISSVSGGGYNIQVGYLPGDPVLIHFSQRALDEFAADMRQRARPIPRRVLSATDAIVGPGFVEPSSTAPASGLRVQDATGMDYVSLSDASIAINHRKAVSITIDGTDIFSKVGPLISTLAVPAGVAASGNLSTWTTPEIDGIRTRGGDIIFDRTHLYPDRALGLLVQVSDQEGTLIDDLPLPARPISSNQSQSNLFGLLGVSDAAASNNVMFIRYRSRPVGSQTWNSDFAVRGNGVTVPTGGITIELRYLWNGGGY